MFTKSLRYILRCVDRKQFEGVKITIEQRKLFIRK